MVQEVLLLIGVRADGYSSWYVGRPAPTVFVVSHATMISLYSVVYERGVQLMQVMGPMSRCVGPKFMPWLPFSFGDGRNHSTAL